jgi:tRNA/rRNA methyltransferase
MPAFHVPSLALRKDNVLFHTRFVLIDTSHPGNVGAAARAMKVMGFKDLVLVRPRFSDVLYQEETIAMASGAADILARARIVSTLDDALEGMHTLCATAMTPRDFGPPTIAPRTYLPTLIEQYSPEHTHGVAFVFGSERHGMRNDDVYRCHACLSIPTHPDYGSLNLAQAIQLIAYEWRQALGDFAMPSMQSLPPTQLADASAITGCLEHWTSVLIDLAFLNPTAPKKLMPRLQQLIHRAQPTQQEIHILRGIARAIQNRNAVQAKTTTGLSTSATDDY